MSPPVRITISKIPKPVYMSQHLGGNVITGLVAVTIFAGHEATRVGTVGS